MNITESNQLTTLLAWLLGEKARPDLPPPPASVAREAAARLGVQADSLYRHLARRDRLDLWVRLRANQ